MARPTRRTSRTKPDFDFEDFTFQESEPKVKVLEDPATLAGELLLTGAIEASNSGIVEIRKYGGVCLVVLPDALWLCEIRNAWQTLVHQGHKWHDPHRSYWPGEAWICWHFDSVAPVSKQLDMVATLATAVSEGRHCVAFASDITFTPSAFIDAADFTIVVSPLTQAILVHLVKKLTGRRSRRRLQKESVSRLSPYHLRIARRRNQSADDYILRLQVILDRERLAQIPAIQSVEGRSLRENPTLDRLHGLEDAVLWGETLAGDLAAVRDGHIDWSQVDRGCLLSGPPGCGKTIYARALAKKCGIKLFLGSYSIWLGANGAHQGEMLKAMAKTFADARAAAPCILFIDEIDSFPNRETVSHRFKEWDTQIVNALLAEIDGAETKPGVIVIGACNHPDKLDPALVRSGRLDRHIRIGLPDREALVKILREHLGSELEGQDLSKITLAAHGCSPADCERFVRGAKRRAREAGRAMTVPDLLKEIGGEENRTTEELWTVAIHELGHALARCELFPHTLIMVSIQRSNAHSGYVSSKHLSTIVRAGDVRSLLICRLAGRAAEELVIGQPSAGAGGYADSDLAQATQIAANAELSWGLNASGRLAWQGMQSTNDLATLFAARPELEKPIQACLSDAYTGALELLRPKLDTLQDLARALVDRGYLAGAEVEQAMACSMRS